MTEHLPDRRKHGYAELEAQLNDHYTELEGRLEAHVRDIRAEFKAFIRQSLVAFGIIGILSSVGLVGFGVILKQEGKTADSIQDERYNSLVRSCEGQNQRHDKTIERIRLRFKPSEQASRIFLIDALQPKVDDCQSYARSRVKGE